MVFWKMREMKFHVRRCRCSSAVVNEWINGVLRPYCPSHVNLTSTVEKRTHPKLRATRMKPTGPLLFCFYNMAELNGLAWTIIPCYRSIAHGGG